MYTKKVVLILSLLGSSLLGSCKGKNVTSEIIKSISEDEVSLSSVLDSQSEFSISEGDVSTSESSDSSVSSRSTSRRNPSSEDSSSSEEISSVSEQTSSESETSSSISTQTSESSLISSTSQDDSDPHWNLDFSQYGKSFRSTLAAQMAQKKKVTCSYKQCLSIGASAAQYPAKSGKFVPFYHTTDTLVTTSSCNREHTWPNSRGSGTSGAGSDPFVIRPTLTSDNSSRGNYFYGIGSNQWDPASLGFEAARGESARVIFYAATLYYESNSFTLSNNPSDSTGMNTMGTLKYLIEWNNKYPVTDIERQINDYLDNLGYGRNPFVDNPNYANYIWDSNGIRTSQYGDGGEGSGSDNPPVIDDSDWYTREENPSKLDGKSFYLVTANTSNGPFYAMTSTEKRDDLPWYMLGSSVTLNSDKTKMTSDVSLEKFTFAKQYNNVYKITSSSGKTLYNYISGSHYSISFTSSVQYDNMSSLWEVTLVDYGFEILGETGVYLSYSNQGSFCGYKYDPGVPIYLYL